MGENIIDHRNIFALKLFLGVEIIRKHNENIFDLLLAYLLKEILGYPFLLCRLVDLNFPIINS